MEEVQLENNALIRGDDLAGGCGVAAGGSTVRAREKGRPQPEECWEQVRGWDRQDLEAGWVESLV